jgi:gamma-glutamyl-gamma-aminobutyrate hydrolase PuuD
MSHPIIGVTGLVRPVSGADRSGVNASYLRSVVQAGGVPLILSPVLGPEGGRHAVEALDGILLTGGDDMDPAHYGEDPHPALEPVDPDRDAFELAVFHVAREKQLPILAICRGFQLANVALGGTLWQDLPSQQPGAVEHRQTGARGDRTHVVELTAESRLARAVGRSSLEVNSFHHQGIRRLAPGLHVTGRSPDGLIEGVESQVDRPWLLAVQWHPEEFHDDPRAPDAGLFQALVHEASNTAASAGRGQWR